MEWFRTGLTQNNGSSKRLHVGNNKLFIVHKSRAGLINKKYRDNHK